MKRILAICMVFALSIGLYVRSGDVAVIVPQQQQQTQDKERAATDAKAYLAGLGVVMASLGWGWYLGRPDKKEPVYIGYVGKAIHDAEQAASPWYSRAWSGARDWGYTCKQSAWQWVRENPKTAAAAAIGTTAVLGGLGWYYTRPKQEAAPVDAPENEPVDIYADTDINAPDPVGNTRLIIAAKTNNYDEVKELLDRGADPNVQNDVGLTALMSNALVARDARIIDLLLEARAHVDVQAHNGATALMLAASNVASLPMTGDDPVIQALVEKGHADITIKDNAGLTALEYMPMVAHNPNLQKRRVYLSKQRAVQERKKGTPQELLFDNSSRAASSSEE